jgi:biofilm protein TabA
MKIRMAALAVAVLLSLFLPVAQAQKNAPERTSKHKAKKWLKKGEWRNGLQLQPHKSVNAIEFAYQYSRNKDYWDKAFAFLRTHDLNKIEKGKYPIDGDNVSASVTADSSKNFDKTNWESHRKYIDLQYVISGEEKMGVWPVAKATVIKPYDEKKDVANYSAEGKFYAATPASFFLFFPSDAHRPNITPGGNKVVKKIVLKIKAAD